MPAYAKPLMQLMEEFARMPGIGRRTAERLAFHILKASKDDALRLADAIRDVKTTLRHCSVCFNITDTDPCAICADPQRNSSTLCVVEQPKDLVAIEQTGEYSGVYHVLMGRIAPLEGVEPGDLTIDALIERVRKGNVDEVILATNADMEGDVTMNYIANALAAVGVRTTGLARGMPSGSQVEYIGKNILSEALKGRHPLQHGEH